jgi:hypothetical protein
VGAFIGAELAGLEAGGALVPGMTVTVAGDDKVGGAWRLALARAGWTAYSLTPAEREAGYLSGLRAIVAARDR